MGWKSLDSGANWMEKLALYDHRERLSPLGGHARKLQATRGEISNWVLASPQLHYR